MINREIPFRPRLEGDFRVRFYDAASSITEHTCGGAHSMSQRGVYGKERDNAG